MATQVQPLPQPNERSLWQRLTPLWIGAAILAGLFVLAQLIPLLGVHFPGEWNLGLRGAIDELQRWVIGNRTTHPLFLYFFDPIADAIDFSIRGVENFLLATSWLLIVGFFALTGYQLGGWRLALLCAASLFVLGLFGLWKESMQTLALMIVAVFIALGIGIPLGIWSATSERVDRGVRPFLDFMQTMPAFVYLAPVVLLFGVARVPAIIATVIFALAPAVRMTSLGIRQTPPSVLEAARSFGSTSRQLLWKIQFPLAIPSIMAGVNQTIMMALGMVVIAAMVGAGGLGREVLVSLQRLQVGKALEAGLAIVLLAIMLDRLSEALAAGDFSASRAPRRATPPPGLPGRLGDLVPGLLTALLPEGDFKAAILARRKLINSVLLLVVLALVAGRLAPGIFPEGWQFSIRQPADAAVDWARDHLYEIGGLPIGTGPLSDFLTTSVLDPARALLRDILPWPAVVMLMALLAYTAGGWRLAVGVGLGMLTIGLLGMWDESMDTLSLVVMTLLCTVLIAVPLGILSASNDRFRSLLRPLLDFLQTVPTFVYLVPVIMLFNVGRVPGLIAAVLYAIPPGVKLTDLGIRMVAPETVEAARSFGSTRGQTLAKVQLPLALPTIMAGVNQMIMMVLAMVIIAGLVGGAGLGLEAVTGLARNETGRGIEAGLAIVILAISLDRMTQGWARRVET